MDITIYPFPIKKINRYTIPELKHICHTLKISIPEYKLKTELINHIQPIFNPNIIEYKLYFINHTISDNTYCCNLNDIYSEFFYSKSSNLSFIKINDSQYQMKMTLNYSINIIYNGDWFIPTKTGKISKREFTYGQKKLFTKSREIILFLETRWLYTMCYYLVKNTSLDNDILIHLLSILH